MVGSGVRGGTESGPGEGVAVRGAGTAAGAAGMSSSSSSTRRTGVGMETGAAGTSSSASSMEKSSVWLPIFTRSPGRRAWDLMRIPLTKVPQVEPASSIR